MFNPVIIAAVVVQGLVAKGSKVAGAIVGYLITTGILIWGLAAYANGAQIAFFGIPLSQSMFLIACFVWYQLDTKEFVRSIRSATKCPVCGPFHQAPLAYPDVADAWMQQNSRVGFVPSHDPANGREGDPAHVTRI